MHSDNQLTAMYRELGRFAKVTGWKGLQRRAITAVQYLEGCAAPDACEMDKSAPTEAFEEQLMSERPSLVYKGKGGGQLPSPNVVRLRQLHRMSFWRAVQPPRPVNHIINSVLPLPEAFKELALFE